MVTVKPALGQVGEKENESVAPFPAKMTPLGRCRGSSSLGHGLVATRRVRDDRVFRSNPHDTMPKNPNPLFLKWVKGTLLSAAGSYALNLSFERFLGPSHTSQSSTTRKTGGRKVVLRDRLDTKMPFEH